MISSPLIGCVWPFKTVFSKAVGNRRLFQYALDAHRVSNRERAEPLQQSLAPDAPDCCCVKANGHLPLALLVLVNHAAYRNRGIRCGGDRRGGEKGGDGWHILLDEWNPHVSAITAFAPVAFVLTNAHLCWESGIAAAAAWSLPVASLLALTAALAARLGGEVGLLLG